MFHSLYVSLRDRPPPVRAPPARPLGAFGLGRSFVAGCQTSSSSFHRSAHVKLNAPPSWIALPAASRCARFFSSPFFGYAEKSRSRSLAMCILVLSTSSVPEMKSSSTVRLCISFSSTVRRSFFSPSHCMNGSSCPSLPYGISRPFQKTIAREPSCSDTFCRFSSPSVQGR